MSGLFLILSKSSNYSMPPINAITPSLSHSLCGFLTFGFFPDYRPDINVDLSDVDKMRFIDTPEEEIFKLIHQSFREILEAEYKPGSPVLLPLSGGLDSRALLGNLLEFHEARDIHTFTFGIPEAADFELSNIMAKTVGTTHRNYNLHDYHYSTETLIAVSKLTRSQTRLFGVAPHEEILRDYRGFQLWSGIMGGHIGGSSIPVNPNMSYDESLCFFSRKHCPTSINLSPVDEKEIFPLLKPEQLIDPKNLSYYEQLNIANKQLKLIYPHVIPTGIDFVAPFLHKKITDIFLSLPNQVRKDKKFYKKYLRKQYPALFTIPSKTNENLSLNSSPARVLINKVHRNLKRRVNNYYPVFFDPEVNYIDFRESSIRRKDFSQMIRENFFDLKERNLLDWIDFDMIWNSRNYWSQKFLTEILLLVSLEIHLKAGKQL